MDESTKLEFSVPVGIEPLYANYAIIQSTPTEFMVTFFFNVPDINGKGTSTPKCLGQIILSPDNAHALQHALGLNLEKYFQAKNMEHHH